MGNAVEMKGVEIGFKLNDFEIFLWDPWDLDTWMMKG